MITSVTTLRDYLATFLGLYGIAAVDFGGTDRILNRQNSNLAYPLLFAELPTIQYTGDDGEMMLFSFRLFVLELRHKYPQYADEAVGYDAVRNIIRQVLNKLTADRNTEGFYFDRSNVAQDFKEAYTADDDFGIFADIQITVANQLC
jgi:hypothetical protein